MTLDLAPKHPITTDNIKRIDYLKDIFPQAASVLQSIQRRIQPFKFGVALKDLRIQYNFVDPDDVANFFKVYLKGSSSHLLGDAYLNECMNKAINRANVSGSTAQNSIQQFRAVAEILVSQIQEQRLAGRSLIRLVMGPTGSGKTAFSKGLITAAIKEFWSHRLVPTRVEYSRFAEDGSTPDEETIIGFIRKCQLRDLLIWYFFSGVHKPDILAVVRSLDLSDIIRTKLVTFQEQAGRLAFDGESVSLRDISQLWSTTIGYLEIGPTIAILDRLNETYGMGFLISFDGFDIVNVEDFVLDKVTIGPLDVVIRLLRGILGKLVRHRSFSRDFDCHFLLYLRDTTYRRVQLEFRRKVGGEYNIPFLWVAPPPYSSLVRKVSALVGNDLDSEVSRARIDFMLENIASDSQRECFKRF